MLDVISLETPQWKWASCRLEGRTSWILTSCGRCSRLSMGTSGTRSGGLRKGQTPCELLGGLSGFLSLRCQGLNLVWSRCRNLRIPLQCWHGSWGTSGVSPGESVLISRGSMHVRFPPELRQQCSASIRVDQGICGFPSRLSQEAFPGGFPRRLSHRAVPRATVV